MWSILALGAVERLIHHWINLDAITRVQFNELEGKVLRVVIDVPQLSIDVFFDHDKIRLEPTVTGHSPASSIFEQRPFDQAQTISSADAILHVKDVVELLKLFLSEHIGNIPLQGDYRLLQDIQRIIQLAEPDLASHLSDWVGPNLAAQIAKIQIVPQQMKRSIKSHLFFAEDFLKEDSGLFAPRWQMDDLQQSTRQLNQDIDRIEARILQLQNQINSSES